MRKDISLSGIGEEEKKFIGEVLNNHDNRDEYVISYHYDANTVIFKKYLHNNERTIDEVVVRLPRVIIDWITQLEEQAERKGHRRRDAEVRERFQEVINLMGIKELMEKFDEEL